MLLYRRHLIDKGPGRKDLKKNLRKREGQRDLRYSRMTSLRKLFQPRTALGTSGPRDEERGKEVRGHDQRKARCLKITPSERVRSVVRTALL